MKSAARGQKKSADVVIVGGGASGLAAAVELGMSSPDLDVLIIEKNDEPGRKIRATGSGRCNITNTEAQGYNEIMRFFRKIGLVTRAYENGLVYPYSESAADVAELLISRAEELGVMIITGAEVTSVSSTSEDPSDHTDGNAPYADRFLVTYTAKGGHGQKQTVSAKYVILSTGGKAGPAYGTTGDGYRIAVSFGHSIVTPVPVLTSIECDEWDAVRKPCAVTLAGTRTRGVVTLYKYGTGCCCGSLEMFKEAGEIQFTRYGLSGIVIFNMTRHMRLNRRIGETLGNFLIAADLFPDGDIEEFLRDRRENAFPGEKTGDVLRTVLKGNIASYVLETAGNGTAGRHLGRLPLTELTDQDIAEIGDAVHGLTFHPVNLRGWKDAQATSGGVSMKEIDGDTGRSALVPGLYITGELADRDFPCGGFNLSNAWLTGIRAAEDISGCQR